MAKKMLFIFNPKAGKGLMKNHIYEIVEIFTKAGFYVYVYPTQKAGDAIEKVQEFAKEVEIIVCSGGDGTLDEVVTGLRQSGDNVPIGYIPAGSTNDFANSLSISKDPIQAARDIVDGALYPCDLGAFNSDTFVYVAAFGVFTDVSYSTNQDLKNALGHMAYILEGAKKITNIPAYWMKVTASGVTLEGEYIYGMITNSKSVGGFKNLIGEGVQLNDGLFEVTLIRKPKNPLEWQSIVTALMTKMDNTDMIDSFKADWVVIEAGEEIPWTLDGEFGGDHSFVRIDAIKDGIELILDKDKIQ
ncbi:MAG: diacylglycerol kinase family lipid kinase [Lachnospiraceae bacterium]|nr:diacylglycerol kinase family lipid kinase [Lachnospiraceae bacterium]MDD3616852.1 diacylglycerol kinase family lipid kinase [Lachnospiraceae bacterium]